MSRSVIDGDPQRDNRAAPAVVRAPLAAFLPRHQLARLSGREQPAQLDDARAAVLFVDVCGFSATTLAYAAQGRAGAELLSRSVADTFGDVIAHVHRYGGDVMVFAGDAVWALWPVGTGQPAELAAACAAAAQSALDIQSVSLSNDQGAPRTFALRASVGVGRIENNSVGGAHGPRFSVIIGDAITDAGRAGAHAPEGGVVLSGAARECLQSAGYVASLAETGVRLTALAPRPPRLVRPLVANVFDGATDQLRSSIPPVVLRHVDSGIDNWLAEFRTITAVFLRWSPVRSRADASSSRDMPEVVDAIEKVVKTYQGDLHQILMDEKGVGAVIAFGLPGNAHGNDADRAVLAAIEIGRALETCGQVSSMGVTTGLVFCDVVGDLERRAYNIAGPALNLAARLMQLTSSAIRCDGETARAAARQDRLEFQALPAAVVAGQQGAVEVFEPRLRRGRSTTVSSHASASGDLIGRRSEREILHTALARLRDERLGGAILIEGDAGMGKSRLVRQLLTAAAKEPLRTFWGAGDGLDFLTPYAALRAVFQSLLGVSDGHDADAVIQTLTARVPRAAADLLPLLNVVSPAPIPENDTTLGLTESVRAQQTRDLLLSLLDDPDNPRPTLLIFEDAHWIDSASRAFLVQAARLSTQLLIVLTTRPLGRDSIFTEQLLQVPRATSISLEPLDDQEIKALICEALRVPSVPSRVNDFVRKRAGGNPFFTIELARAMLDNGTIQVVGDDERVVTISASVHDVERAFDDWLQARGLPGDLSGLLATRVDRLEPRQQVVLKLASVVGETFSPTLLGTILPDSIGPTLAAAIIDELVEADFLRKEGDADEAPLGFSHAILRDAVYSNIPFAQRKDLHRAIAEAIERSEQGQGNAQHRVNGVLAHHYRRAGLPEKALGYLESAGAQALTEYANDEAVRFLSEAAEVLDLPELANAAGPDLRRRRAGLRLDLGRAYVSNSNYSEGCLQLEQGLAIAGRRMRRSTPAVIVAALSAAIRQWLHRKFDRRIVGRRAGDRRWLLQLARTYEALTESYFNLGANLPCVVCALESLNLAELAGTSAELARGYASVGAILGFTPLRDAARAYCRRARATAQALGDRAARAWVELAVGVFEAGLGNWSEALSAFAQTVEIGRLVGDGRRADDGMSNEASIRFLNGDIAASTETARYLVSSAQRRNDVLMQADAFRRLAYCALVNNDNDELARQVDNLLAIRRADFKKPLRQRYSDVHVLSAWVHHARGQDAESAREATLAASILEASSPMFYDVVLEHSFLTELLIDRRPGPVDAEGRSALRRLRGFARVFTIAQPAARIWQGAAAFSAGKLQEASRSWEQGARAASALKMPYFEAIARRQLQRAS